MIVYMIVYRSLQRTRHALLNGETGATMTGLSRGVRSGVSIRPRRRRLATTDVIVGVAFVRVTLRIRSGCGTPVPMR